MLSGEEIQQMRSVDVQKDAVANKEGHFARKPTGFRDFVGTEGKCIGSLGDRVFCFLPNGARSITFFENVQDE